MTARIATVSAPAVLLAALAWTSGGYFPRTWGALLLVGAIALAVWAILAAEVEASPMAAAAVIAFFVLAAWQLLSQTWGSAPDAAVLEGERTLVYGVGALAAVLLVPTRRTGDLIHGVLAGTAVVSIGGLGEHLAGDAPGERLESPIGYWNAAGIVAAAALLLGIGVALDSSGRSRVLAACSIPPVTATLALSYSRGSLVALAIGLVALVVLRRRGRVARAHRRWARPGAIAAAVLLLAAAGVTVVEITRNYSEAAMQGPQRLLSTSTSDRAAYWEVAASMVSREPMLGEGAGAFERAWLRDRPAPIPVRDAHNLYLETLAELGPVGLGLLVVAMGIPLLALRRSPTNRPAAAAAAAYVAIAVHASLDWDWELPVVMLSAVLLGVGLMRSGDGRPTRPLSQRTRLAALGAAALVGALAAVVHTGNSAVEEAHRALDRNDGETARDAALRARRFAPWSAEPWQLLGEAELLDGRIALGREHLHRATREDPGAWTAWLALAFATHGQERAMVLAQARALNPLAPELEIAARAP